MGQTNIQKQMNILNSTLTALLLATAVTTTQAKENGVETPGNTSAGMFVTQSTTGASSSWGCHPWKGKRVAYFGDSITDPNHKAANRKYWSLLQEWLGITPYVYAVSGRQWNDIPRQADKLKAEHGNEFDAILIFIGTNDFNAGVPVGEWFTEQEEEVMAGIHEQKHLVKRMRKRMCMTDSTYRGRINIALDKVKRMFPGKQVVLVTPIHRAGFYLKDTNWQPTEEYRNKCGEYVSSYVESVKEAGNIWSVPVIDMNTLSGLYPLMDEQAEFFNNRDTDRLHPNNEGHRRMALTLMYQLATLPVF